MILIDRERPSHWYLPDGTPFYEVQRADGSGMRGATLRDARKVGAYPSVTNILSIMAKPGLEAWKQEQAILSSLTLPRIDGESADAFAKRVVDDMGSQVGEAADLGSLIHSTIEGFLTNGTEPEADSQLAALFGPVKQWIKENVESVIGVELCLVNKEGYAGKCDLIAELKGIGATVIDFKTQKFRKGKASFYETWPLQLAAYKHSYFADHRPAGLMSVAINSAEPAPVQIKRWDEGYGLHLAAFQSLHQVWKYMNRYDPLEFRKQEEAA